MGFIEDEERLRQHALEVKQAENAEIARLEAEEALRMQLAQEDKNHGPEDNTRIGQILDQLPKFNLPEYLGVVRRVTGYDGTVHLYTRDDGLRLANQELLDKLDKIGLKPDYNYGSRFLTFHPRAMFCPVDINPRNWFVLPISEPQKPGIGIHLGKFIESTNDMGSRTTTEVTKHVFVRFRLPNMAMITGSGESVEISSFGTFDDALKRGFTHPHTRRYSFPYQQKWIPDSG